MNNISGFILAACLLGGLAAQTTEADEPPCRHAMDTVKAALEHVEAALEKKDFNRPTTERYRREMSIRYYGADEQKPIPWVYDEKQNKRIDSSELGAVYIISFFHIVRMPGGAFNFVCSAEDGHIIGVIGYK